MGRRLLVIDDDPTARRLVRSAVEPEGWTVDDAGSAGVAVDLAATRAYDAIVLDFVLPDADGLQVLDAFARRGVAAPVVAMSASPSPAVATQLLRHGVVEYLNKERLTPLRILHSLQRALDVQGVRVRIQGPPSEEARARHAAAPPRAPNEPVELAVMGPAPPATKGRRVLIVDDTDDARFLVRRLLARDGWTVDEARNGAEALAAAKRARPDVILLDYVLPDTDGVALTRALRDAGTAAAVLALTGHGSERVAEAFIRAGATDFLSKDDLLEGRLLVAVRNALWVAEHAR